MINSIVKLKKWWNLQRLKRFYVTPKGTCFRDYCLKIVNGEWTEADRIQTYEDQIEDFNRTVIAKTSSTNELCSEIGPEIIRLISCKILSDILSEIKED